MNPQKLFPATVMPDRDWWHALWPNPDNVVKALHIGAGMTVIDLGYGDGYFTAAIVNWHPLPRETTPVLGQPRGPRTELRLSAEQTQQAVEPAGLRLETLVELPPYHYGAIFRKTA
ncbi:hypothetical protein CAP31_09845 [Sulfuriferula sp. AH1]|uniref:hypothetical protein n=1 Tax=Sulfuriferula sp. AH1 TaxID=1985873 RepID=UPI000B3B4726|nr:hypothetical protein [Sulfuriferula sp. AH1]ARU31952.1 hypothetical protein CAP31_09845 [Sulfuriferula sp. AH1]